MAEEYKLREKEGGKDKQRGSKVKSGNDQEENGEKTVLIKGGGWETERIVQMSLKQLFSNDLVWIFLFWP